MTAAIPSPGEGKDQAADGPERLQSDVESFLRSRLPPSWVRAIDTEDADGLARARADLDLGKWWVDLAEAGYVTPAWPTQYGGLGVDARGAVAVFRALGRYKVPRFANPVGVGQVGSVLLEWGTADQKDRFLRPIARHDEIWCQLFSEPGAGSDLAGLSTRAQRDGDLWRIEGQKVWTSLAHLADFGLLLARTDPSIPKHRGLTAFLLPMRQPGVEVRALRQMTGDAEFSEVFLDGAVTYDNLRLGETGDGWRIARSVLSGERRKFAGPGEALPGTAIGRSVESLLRRHGPATDPLVRQRLVQAYVGEGVAQMTNQRNAVRRRAGKFNGAEGSIMKLFYSEHAKRLQSLACDLDGVSAQAWPEGDRWSHNTVWGFLRSQSRTIAGGTSEIQRTIIAERVLGLPREVEVDRDIPWSEVRRT